MSSANRWYDRDRRRKPTPAISAYLFWGKRRTVPPELEGNYYIDRPKREAWQSGVLLLCLSILDARLSLILFESPMFHELNPLLWVTLQYGDAAFLTLKLLLTVFSAFILLIHWHFVVGNRRIPVASLINGLIGAYFLIIVYEAFLLTKMFRF